MIARKPDEDRIRQFLEDLARQSWLQRTERRLWPRFVFHYTDLQNAVRILTDGYVYSRSQAERLGKLLVSSGSSQVLSGTNEFVKQSVRFYFRPKTPTQYWAEGIRSSSVMGSSKFPDAHCPVPVFFLFDSADILTRADCRFSDGNLASSGFQIFSTADDLNRLPWRDIYHNTWIRPEESRISFHRCAEVIIPHQVDLSALRYICCRSEAEKETLLYMLPQNLRAQYRGRITATNRIDLFERKHTFVEVARLGSDGISFEFSPDTASPGPFHCVVTVTIGERAYLVESPSLDLKAEGYRYGGNFRTAVDSYEVRLTLDEHIAYANRFEDVTDIPF
ncbi:MAG: DarT ssDNA thymidine ADP-ribosyltransferase family protein [Caldilineaceae bacterium]